MLPKLIIFDLDDTLAVSKSAITLEMATRLQTLLDHTQVAIMTGGRYAQIEKQVLPFLPDSTRLANLFLFPTSGAAYYRHEGSTWQVIYEHRLTPEQIAHISDAIKQAQISAGVVTDPPIFGPQIEDRETQVSWSALGQECPSDLKKVWDPTKEKRLKMLPFLETALPEFEIRIGGTTTIDITQKGINKKYGIQQMHHYLSVDYQNMLYIGDAIFPGGNDYAAIEAGIPYRQTEDHFMTLDIIDELLASL